MNIEIRLSEKEFIRFGLFDTLSLKRGWVRPALFAAILGGAAAVCFIMHQRRGAVLLGSVLLAVAAGLPAAWFLNFFVSLRKQAAAQGLGQGKHVYTLTLDGGGVRVDNGRERADFAWDQVFRVCRRPEATYLYITPQRAFLIPHHCAEGGGDGLWSFLQAHVPEARRA